MLCVRDRRLLCRVPLAFRFVSFATDISLFRFVVLVAVFVVSHRHALAIQRINVG